MGQPIDVQSTAVRGEILSIETDRGITGQDGAVFEAAESTTDDFPGRLAAEIFENIDGVTHVFVASNQVVIGREDGWDDAAAERAASVVSGFFVFYA